MKNPFRTLQGRFTLYLSVLIVAMMSALAYWNISREKGLMEKTISQGREGPCRVLRYLLHEYHAL